MRERESARARARERGRETEKDSERERQRRDGEERYRQRQTGIPSSTDGIKFIECVRLMHPGMRFLITDLLGDDLLPTPPAKAARALPALSPSEVLSDLDCRSAVCVCVRACVWYGRSESGSKREMRLFV